MEKPLRRWVLRLLAVISGILVAVTVFVPSKVHDHPPYSESSAIATLKTIYAAQIQYQSTFNRFASTMAELGPPAGTGAREGPEAAGLVSAGLAAGESDGYGLTLSATPLGFAVSAVPKTFGGAARRTFYLDQSGVMREGWGPEPATVHSPPAGAAN